MASRAGLAAVVLFALSCGGACSRGSRSNVGAADATAGSSASMDAALAVSTAAPSAIFSAPIAGARVAAGEVIAAGLVVATHAIVAERIGGSGRAAWTRAVIPDVSWSADAELHAWPLAAGAAALVWRGPVAGKSAHVAVIVAADGRVVEGPLPVGSLVCATDEGLAWGEPTTGGSRVHLRTWAGSPPAPRDDLGATIAEDFTLTCGAHRAYAVVEGDETTPTRIIATGAAPAGAVDAVQPLTTIPPLALGRDEERDLFPWAEGDELGLVRIASGGGVQAGDLHAAGIAPLRSDRMRVPPEDDVVAIDADARQVVVVTTHDESDACPDGRGGAGVQVLRFPRARDGAAPTTLRVSPSACTREVGPFWTNLLGRAVMLGWTERASRPEKKSAPITGLAFRSLEEGAATGHVAQAADAIADAQCDETHCYAVALVRDPGADGMTPESLRVLTYP